MGAFRPVRIFFKPFRQGLAENGYFEDKNVTLDWRCAEGRFDRTRNLAPSRCGTSRGRTEEARPGCNLSD